MADIVPPVPEAEGGEPPGWRGVASETIDTVKGTREALVVVGIAIYAAVRLGYEGFYERLGVAPAEVGVTYSDIVSRAALGFALFGSWIIALVALAITARNLVRPHSADQILRRSETRRAVAHVGIALAVVAVAVLVISILIGRSGIIAAAVIGLSGTTMAWLGWNDAFTSPQRRALRKIVGLACLGFFIAAVLVFSEQWGESKAEIVKQNEPLRAQPLIGVFSQSAQLVCVSWIGSDKPENLRLDEPLVFLGQSQGVAILYRGVTDPASNVSSGSVRLPLGKIALDAAQDSSKC